MNLCKSPAYCLLLVLIISPFSVSAEFADSNLNQSLITVRVYKGKDILSQGSGFVVQSDRFNGYVVTNTALVTGGDAITVRVPDSGAELVGRVLRTESKGDFALLKVNGLNLPVLQFSADEPAPGEVERGVRLMRQVAAEEQLDAAALKYFCLVALNLNEFVYLD